MNHVFQELCLYRHVLSICMESWRLSADMIIQDLRIPHAQAEELMQRLDEDSVFKAKKGSEYVLHYTSHTLRHDVTISKFQ